MIEKLEIHHLRTLNALYQFENLSSVAEYLNVSQQAISLKLKTLREILSDQLFIRTGHGMAATDYAKAIEPYVQQVLNDLNNIPLPTSITPSTVERTLVISATDYTQKIIVGELINDLRTSAPKTRIIVKNIESANLTKQMHQGEIDLVFTSHGYVPEGLLSQPLFVENYLCVTSDKSLLTEKCIPLENLVERDFIVVSPGVGSLQGSADAWFIKQGFPRNITVSVPTFFMAQEYLRQTNMVGFIPSRLFPCDGLFEIPIKKFPPGYEVVVAYHPRVKGDPFMDWLLKRVNQKFCDLK